MRDVSLTACGVCSEAVCRAIGRRYQKRGYVFGYISHFEGMETGDIVARVVEGRVNKVKVVPVDEEGIPRINAGEIRPEVILRELPFKVHR